jgi:hypothetical protein
VKKWMMKSASPYSNSLKALLDQGWEPFAVDKDTVWLKKAVNAKS